MGQSLTEPPQGGIHIGAEGRLAAMDTEESVGTESLHQTLHGTLPEDPFGFFMGGMVRFGNQPIVEGE